MKNTGKWMMVAVAITALTACGGGGDDGSSGGGDPADVPLSQAPALVQEYAGLFNNLRMQSQTCGGEGAPGVQPLTKWNPKMQQAAQKHADDMSKNGFLSHTGSDGSDSTARNASFGYQGSTMVENIARGYSSPESVTSAWMKSKGHCLGIMVMPAKSLALAKSGKYTVMVFGD